MDAVALLGAACRLPGADTPAAFWALLTQGVDLIEDVPADRFDVHALFDPSGAPGTTPSRWGSFLADPWGFDAAAFGLKPREATATDPQQRLLLTCAREALLAAGLWGGLEGRTVGVFVGATYATHGERVLGRWRAGLPIPAAGVIGNLDNMLAARIAHALDLQGPALTVDTACSSTLVALHLARRALQVGDCDLALVGGSHLLLSPTQHLMMGRAGALSPTGRCRPFAADADGIALGEGVGVFVVGRLTEAVARGWPILARVCGSAVGNDGQSLNPMAPRPGGQVATLQAAWREVGRDPASVALVEAHGTGTPMGDPVEAWTLARVFGRGFKHLGSVKGNVGHLLGAAGVPALLKACWALQTGIVPPSLHCTTPRADLGLAEAGFRIPTTAEPWAGGLVGLNAFGFGGTNAHVVLEAVAGAPAPALVEAARGPALRLDPAPELMSAWGPHPLLRRSVDQRLGRFEYAAEAEGGLLDHRVGGRAILPGAALLDLMWVAGERALGAAAGLADVVFERPAEAGPLSVVVAVGGIVEVADAQGRLAVGRVVARVEVPPEPPPFEGTPVSPGRLYAALERMGMVHGPAFRRVIQLAVETSARPDSAFQETRVLGTVAAAPPVLGTRLCPWALDAALQVVAAGLLDGALTAGLWVPAGAADVRAWGRMEGPLQVQVTHLEVRPDEVQATVDIRTADGALCAWVGGLRLRRSRITSTSKHFFDEVWQLVPAQTPPSRWLGTLWEAPTGPLEPALAALDVALADAGGRPLRVVVRARGLDPAAAAVAAAVASRAADWPGGDLAAVDLPPGLPIEHARSAPAGPRVAWRDGWRLPSWVSGDAPLAADPPTGVWLVTGGAGGLGLAFAAVLSGCTCVLLGRSAPNPEQSARVAALGASYLRGDAAHPAPIIAEILSRFGRLDGVVHAAGGVADRAETLAGKWHGALALAEALDTAGLNPAVLLVSSASAVEPTLLANGLADYAAANAGLLALATQRQASGRRWWAAAFGPIAHTGLAARAGVLERLAQRGWHGLDPQVAARAGLALLGGSVAWRIVADWRPIEAAPLPDPRVDLQGYVRALVARALKRSPDEVPVDLPFTVLGLDSLDAVELARTLDRAGLGPVSDALFFEARTVATLTRVLAGRRTPAATPTAPVPVAEPTHGPPSLSAAQRAFLLQAALFPSPHPFAWLRQTVEGPLDLGRLQRALTRLTHHRALRLGLVDGTLQEGPPNPLKLLDYTVTTDAALARLGDALAAAPFAQAPLMRVARVRQGVHHHLILVAHHAVVDGWSLFLLARTLWTLYADPEHPLPPEAAAVAEGATGPGDATPVAPWPPLPDAGPVDGPRTATLRWLTAEETVKLGPRAAELGVTPFALVAAALARALGAWVGAPTVTLNVAVSRRGAATAEAIGSFAETVPLTLPTTEPLAATVALAAERFERARLGPAGGAGAAPDGGPAVPSPFALSFAAFQAEPPAGLDLVAVAARTATAATRVGLTVWRAGGRFGLAVNTPERMWTSAQRDALADRLSASLQAAIAESFQWVVPTILAACQRSPHVLAVEGLTYAALEHASARFAAGLAAQGIGPGAVVAVETEAGAGAVVALLGVLRAGAAWMPLDPAAPPARTALMHSVARPALTLRGVAEATFGADGPAPDCTPEPGQAVCILFTSGSTGVPKGVPVSARALSAYLHWAVDMLGIGPGDHLLATSALTFDASLRQLLAPLMTGATIHPVTRAQARDPQGLWGRLRDESITHLNTSPAQLARLLAASTGPLPALRHVTVGGEALPTALARAWCARHPVPLINLYGPTEATINTTFHAVDPADDPIPIGRPLPGWQVAVLDAAGRPTEEGELAMGGVGLFAGYLGEGPAPLVTLADGRQVWRSGDRVRRRADGALLFLGRLDDQVQVRGVRVELGEVEAALMSHPAVRLVAAALRGAGTDTWLEAWVETEAADPEALRTHVAAHLPEAMVPRRIHCVAALALGPTGKVDRARLGAAPPVARVAVGGLPEGEAEAHIAAILSEHLQISPIGRGDDFFALGGDSLLAVQIATALGAPAALVYRHPKVADLAVAWAALRPEAAPPDDHQLSPAQAGFVLAERRDPSRPAIWRARFELAGVQPERLQTAWRLLGRRHPLVRAWVEGRQLRFLAGDLPPLTDAPLPEHLAMDAPPLLRGRLTPTATGAILDVLGHHLIGDAGSTQVMVHELLALHDDPDITLPTPAPWPAVVAAQRQPPAPEALAWWRAIYALPYADPGDAGLDGPPHSTLRTVPRTDAGHLLDALAHALADRTGQSDLVIAVARSGRDLPVPGIAHVVGPLATVLPVRLRPGQGTSALRAALAHALPPAALGADLPASAGRFVLSFLTLPPGGDPRIHAVQTAMARPADTCLQLVARPDGDALDLHFTGGPAVEALADAVVAALGPQMPRCEAALITYLPPRAALPAAAGLFGDHPRWIAHAESPWGRLGVLALPRFGAELAQVTAEEVADAVALAREAGARVVALAGLLPARTDYGHAVAGLLTEADGACLTTGHAVTAVAVVATVQHILAALEVPLAELTVGLVGCGSVGRAVIALLCGVLGAPAELVVCDLPERRLLVTHWGQSLPTRVTFAAAEPGAPDALYRCDLIVGASSGDQTVDVARLRPGCVLVDDSFPPCFSVDAALDRMQTTKDVLLVGGGQLDLGAPWHLPPGVASQLAGAAHRVAPAGLPGCAAEAVLCLAGLPTGLGLVQPERARAAWALAQEVGARPAPLHLGTFRVPDALVTAVARWRRA